MRRTGRYLFTSESITEGHPDKIADQVSDAVLDAVLAQDPTGRVACETLLTTGLIVLAGEITTHCTADFTDVAREAVRQVGYTRAKYGFDADTCAVVSTLHGQSPDIAMGVDPGGAGDQGLMFGYACSETTELMPLPIMLSHRLVRALSETRRSGQLGYLRPDGKSQVTVEYDGDTPVRIDAVVVSSQHSEDVSTEQIRQDLTEKLVKQVIPQDLLDESTRIYINPTGRFVTGGPHGDCGPHWSEDHRRHLRWNGAAWWGSLLRQGSDKSRPVGFVHGPLHRQELRCGRAGRPCAGAAGVCYRPGRSGLGPGGDVRNRKSRGTEDVHTGA